jgi:PAS domain S-box-containing protein
MTPIQHRIWVRYGTAVAAVVLATLLKFTVSGETQFTSPFVLFLGSVLFSSWFGGIGPGLLATVLAVVVADYFFLPPLYSFAQYSPEQTLRILQFVGEGGFISLLSGLRRHYGLKLHRQFEELRVTLRSIADAVVSTNARGAVDFLNPVAESLTGWAAAEAAGRPVADTLCLIDEATRAPVDPPTRGVIATGQPVTLPDRTLLVGRDGAERPVAGSAAPICGVGGELLGAVLVLHDMTERRLAEELLRTRLLSRLATIQEDERRRIARELHDEAGQQLTALTLGLKALRGRPEAGPLEAALASLQELAELTAHAAHHLAWQLRPTALDDLGLEKALRDSFERWSERADVPVDFHCALGPERLPPDLETHLYRIVREALTNVRRHAMATHVGVILERRPDHLLAIVEDDGLGFDPEKVRQAASAEHRLGLFGMEERAALMGGKLTVESGPGRGTTVFVRVPLDGRKGEGGEEDPRLVGG